MVKTSFTLSNANYDTMSLRLESDLKEAVKRSAVSTFSSTADLSSTLEVTISAGSIVLNLVAWPPTGTSVDQLLSAFAVQRSALTTSITSEIEALDTSGIATGTVVIQDVAPTQGVITNPLYRGTLSDVTPASNTATYAAIGGGVLLAFLILGYFAYGRRASHGIDVGNRSLEPPRGSTRPGSRAGGDSQQEDGGWQDDAEDAAEEAYRLSTAANPNAKGGGRQDGGLRKSPSDASMVSGASEYDETEAGAAKPKKRGQRHMPRKR